MTEASKFKRAYVTILGRSTWALINSFYAVLESNYYPDTVHVFLEEIYSVEKEKVEAALKIFKEEFNLYYEVTTHITGESDFVNAGKQIYELLKNLIAEGFEVAVDITSGRKYLVAAALLPASKLPVHHLFYLELKNLRDAAKPYYMIPLGIQRLRDFVQDASLSPKGD